MSASGDLRSVQSGKFELGPYSDLEIDSGNNKSLSNKNRKFSNDKELSLEYIMPLLELGEQKNALFKQQDDFMYIIQSQRLEEEQYQVEEEIRQLMEKPDSEKTEEDRQKEAKLMMKRIKIIDQKKSIIDSIEMDRRRKENKRNESLVQDEANKKRTDKSGKKNETQKNNNGIKVLKRVGIFAAKTALITGAVIGGTTLALPLIGFGSLGPIGGSLAALYQSSVLGGTIASGSAFATLQSVGMVGLSAAAQGAVCAGSAAVSGAHEVYHHVKNKKDKK